MRAQKYPNRESETAKNQKIAFRKRAETNPTATARHRSQRHPGNAKDGFGKVIAQKGYCAAVGLLVENGSQTPFEHFSRADQNLYNPTLI